MRILILGGAGFIGSHLVEQLHNNGEHEMVVVDNLSSGLRDNIPQSIQFYKMDIRDHEVEHVFKKHQFDVVVNLAAQTMVPFSLKHPDEDADINILGLINVLECCRKYSVKRIIFSSSAAVYGNNTNVPLKENAVLMPMSFYGITKMAAEHYLRVYHELYGLDIIIFRFANVYGERQGNGGEGGVVSIFGRRIAAGLPLTLFGDGGQTRDFVYAGDIAEAIAAALNAEGCLVLNVSNGIEVSINELINNFAAISNKHLEIEYEDAREGDIYRSCLDNTALIKALNTSLQTSLQTGLAKTYSYFTELIREEDRLG